MYLQDEDGGHEVPRNLWSRRGTIIYNAGGERDVLILATDLSLPPILRLCQGDLVNSYRKIR